MTPDTTWTAILAGAINTTGVLVAIQIGKRYVVPALWKSVPALIPILAGALGPAVAVVQNVLAAKLGVPLDLSPIVAAFTGGSAVAVNQFFRLSLPPQAPLRKMLGSLAVMALLLVPTVAWAAEGAVFLSREDGTTLTGAVQVTTVLLVGGGGIVVPIQGQVVVQYIVEGDADTVLAMTNTTGGTLAVKLTVRRLDGTVLNEVIRAFTAYETRFVPVSSLLP